MLNYKISLDEYFKMINEQEFELVEYDYRDFEEFEKLITFGYNIANMFEDLAEDLGRIPTQKEFIKEGLVRSRAYFLNEDKLKDGIRWLPIGKYPSGKPIWYGFRWNKKLKRAVKSRLARSYPSHVVEYSTILTIKNELDDYDVGVSDYLDTVAGIDFVVGNEKLDKALYVHITNGSNYSEYWLNKKEGRTGKGWDDDGNKYEFKRSFKKGHLHLTFNNFDSHSTEIINGIPFIRLEHIEQVLELSFKAPYTDSYKKLEQVDKLDDWLIENDISFSGSEFFWL